MCVGGECVQKPSWPPSSRAVANRLASVVNLEAISMQPELQPEGEPLWSDTMRLHEEEVPAPLRSSLPSLAFCLHCPRQFRR